MTARVGDFLAASQNSDGGWGYGRGQASNVEAVAAVALATGNDPALEQPRQAAFAWLTRAQNRDGGWGFAGDDPQSGWMTAWAVLALARTSEPTETVARGAQWLLRSEAIDASAAKSSEEIQRTKSLHGMDLTLRAWSWLPGQASFVEPTAMALWALASVAPSSAIRSRMDQAVRYLVDRRCLPAGWNVGNPMMFSRAFPPRACPTAWTLLALKRAAPEAIRAADSDALRSDMHLDGGVLALAWGLLALRALGQEDLQARARLVSLQSADGSWAGSPHHTAIVHWAFGATP